MGSNTESLNTQALGLFLARLKSHFEAPTPEKVRLVVGGLPDDLSFDLPLPTGGTVVGSLAYDGRITATIILDIPLPAWDIISFYVKELRAQGFRPRGGFSFNAALYRDKQYVEFEVNEIEGAPTEVMVAVFASAVEPHHASNTQHEAQSLVPGLFPPASTVVHDETLSLLDAGKIINLQAELTPAELVALYAPQFADDGWQHAETSALQRAAWSFWLLASPSGQSYTGMLLIADYGREPNNWCAMMRVVPQK